MKKISLTALILMAVLTTAGLVLADNTPDDTMLNQIAGYRQWTRVNRDPVQVNVQADATKATTIDLSATAAV